MTDLAWGVLSLIGALSGAVGLGWCLGRPTRYFISIRSKQIECALLVLLIATNSFGCIKSLKKVGVGTLLPEKSLVIGAQYLTVCTNKNNGKQVGILQDDEGLKAYELVKEPPRIFWVTGNSKNPYKDGASVTSEEFVNSIVDLIRKLKKAQELQKSTTTQNGN